MKKLFLILLILPALACYISNPAQATGKPTPSAAITAAPVIYETIPTGTQEPACSVTAESLNVRSRPEGTAESNVLTWLYSGDLVTILDSRGAWLHIRAGSVTGWINSNYCKGK